MTYFLIISFIAGVLTILAPCAFTLLPVIIGGSADSKSKFKPLIITLSLSLSVFLFTILVRGTTLVFAIEQSFWNIISGLILIFFGLISLYPQLWDNFNVWLGLSSKSDEILEKAVNTKESPWQSVLLGASLGPVFSSCSPTFAVLLSSVLQANFWEGVLYIFSFTLGLSLVLLLIGYGGQLVISKLRFAVNPNGVFKKSLGLIFLLLGIFIISGLDKSLEAWVVENGTFNVGANLEAWVQENWLDS